MKKETLKQTDILNVCEAVHNLSFLKVKSSMFNNSNSSTSNLMNSDLSRNKNINSIYCKQNKSLRHQPLRFLDEQLGNGILQKTYNSLRGGNLISNQMNKHKSNSKLQVLSKLKMNYH